MMLRACLMKAKIKLFFLYVRCMSLKRLGNVLLIHCSFLLSKVTGIIFHWGNAFAVSVETVAGCNFQCPGCETGAGMIGRKPGKMNIEQFKKILSKIPSTVFHINLHFQGEPLLHENIAEFVMIARSKNMFVSMSTNAQLLNEHIATQLINAGLSQIIISIDGYDCESYDKYRKGGNFDTVVSNLRQLSALKKHLKKNKPLIEVQTVVLSHNEYHLKEIEKLAFTSGADIFSMKTAYVTDLSSTPDYFPLQKKYQRYHVLPDGGLKSIKQPARFCFRMWSSCVITNNFLVVPCCFDKQGEFTSGNLLSDNFHDVFKGEYKKHLMQQLLKRKPMRICRNCI